MGKGKEEFEVEIKVWAGEDAYLQIYSWKELISQNLRPDRKFHPIKFNKRLRSFIEAVGGIKFLVPVEILLGNYVLKPLFVVVKKVGDLSFFQGRNNPVGIQLFNENEAVLQKATEAEIQEEFKNKLLEFLEMHWKTRLDEATSHGAEMFRLINESNQIRGLCAYF